jgi:hypothetical protein
MDDLDGRPRQTKSIAKPVDVLLNGGATVRIYDHNRLALAGGAFGVQRIHSIRCINIRRRIAVKNGRARITIRVYTGERSSSRRLIVIRRKNDQRNEL